MDDDEEGAAATLTRHLLRRCQMPTERLPLMGEAAFGLSVLGAAC
jgi:hypothetical protein